MSFKRYCQHIVNEQEKIKEGLDAIRTGKYQKYKARSRIIRRDSGKIDALQCDENQTTL